MVQYSMRVYSDGSHMHVTCATQGWMRVSTLSLIWHGMVAAQPTHERRGACMHAETKARIASWEE